MNRTIHTIDLKFLDQPNGIAAFLVETSIGPILIETGPHSTLSTLVKAINKIGYQKEDIKHVFITHIHLDHAGAAWCFAAHGAKIYLHPFGYKHVHDPSKLLASAKMIYKEKMDYLWGTLKPISADQLITVDHGQSIEIDSLTVQAWHTPGHAKHHIAWQIGTDLFTGDVAGVCINDGPVIPPCPPPDINIEHWQESLDIIESLDTIETYYLTHFGKVTSIQAHIKLLRESLTAYSSFVKPYHDRGDSSELLLPDFTAFVNDYLTSHGMSMVDANAYEAANPSNMSVAGLMRYWHKKEQ